MDGSMRWIESLEPFVSTMSVELEMCEEEPRDPQGPGVCHEAAVSLYKHDQGSISKIPLRFCYSR